MPGNRTEPNGNIGTTGIRPDNHPSADVASERRMYTENLQNRPLERKKEVTKA